MASLPLFDEIYLNLMLEETGYTVCLPRVAHTFLCACLPVSPFFSNCAHPHTRQQVALKRAEAILLEREQATAKEAEAAAAAGEAGGGTIKRKPLVKQAVAELLRSFGSFAQLEVRRPGFL